MPKIALLNLPFASILRPAIGLTQIKSRIDASFGAPLTVEILYLNIDFSHYVGVEFYDEVADSLEHNATGFGDWFFRQAAFPESTCNADEYFRRYYPQRSERNMRLRQLVETKRQNLVDEFDRLIDRYQLDRADIVGMSSTFAQNVACIAMARLLKLRHPEHIVVIGGANCESVMGRALVKNVRAVDFIFSGSALISFPKFVQHYLDGDTEKMHAIPGVFSRKNQATSTFGVLGQSSVPSNGEDLDINTTIEYNYDDYLSKFFATFPGAKKRPALLFETSRGCWWGEKAHCKFCGLNGTTMGYRSMKPEHAIQLIGSLDRYADSCSSLRGVDNIMPQHYVKEVFARLPTLLKTNVFYEVKADLTETDLFILSKAGARLVQPGIESLATSTLRLMKKGTTASQNIQFLRNCLMSGIRPFWNLLVGFPGEGEAVYRKYCTDLLIVTHLTPPGGVFTVRFDRFSPYFNRPQEYGLDLRPLDYYDLTYPFDAHVLSEIAYYFADHNYEADYFVAIVEWFDKLRRKVSNWQKLWSATSERAVGPKLHFIAETGCEIIDSRNGCERRYDVGTLGRRLLESLYKPQTFSTLARAFPNSAVSREIDGLESRGLLFRDGDRLVSLVCPREPPMPPIL